VRSQVGRSQAVSDSDPELEDLVDYCARPRCRAEFRRSPGPGRRQAFCSEMCRRTAERELRQARARLRHFHGVVAKLQSDVDAFGRSVTDAEATAIMPVDLAGGAELAIERAAGALDAFPNPDDPAVRALRRLHDAVAPFVHAQERAV
jgi:hypothetical protein